MQRETVQLNYLRMAPRKVRLIANLVKGLPVNEAEAQLMNWSRRAAEPILKLLRSAIANALHNKKMDKNKLVVEIIRVDQGPTLKRFLPRAQGRATDIHKKTSHVTLTIKEIDKTLSSRFTILTKEPKEKSVRSGKEKVVKSKKTAPKPEMTESTKKPVEKQDGFIKKIFNRKSV